MPRPEEFELMDPAAPRHVVVPKEAQRRRILIVGDIHGCADEFRALLAKYGQPDDTLILVGDLVNKGPKSAEVVALARELGAFAVVGNHELASLAGRHARRGGRSPDKAKKYAWTDNMSEADVEFVRKLPYTLSLPLHNAVVVHAGLVPGVPLEEQTPHNMVSMRTVRHGPDGYKAFESDEDGAVAWALVHPGPEHVYFGHDAKRQLQLCSHATGLDTGCLYGNSLTAAILELGQPARRVSVPARRTYVKTGGGGMCRGLSTSATSQSAARRSMTTMAPTTSCVAGLGLVGVAVGWNTLASWGRSRY